LNILAFLVKPERGELFFGGILVSWKRRELIQLRKKITLLQQSPYLFVGTVFGNVSFGLKARGITGENLRRSVADSLTQVRLDGFEDRDVGQLSGGEARRVALARALALKPELLLLDEPLANVDIESATVIEQLISSLPDQGTTVVMSTHDLQLGERMECDVIQLLGGRLVQTMNWNVESDDTTCNELLACPALKMRSA
jgi:tungstate transport system ATP-binding protein